MAESGGNPDAVGDVALGGSIGLWQIYTVAHPEYDAQRLTDPPYNAQAAYAISSSGTNWTPWSTYNSGAYEKYYTGPAGFACRRNRKSESSRSRPSASTTRTARATSAASNVRFLASTTTSAAACGASPS